ncbi:hypothetical protein [Saccharothrix obliqua]|uniref:hypothetical protein n=1 Tax=Saccharothrix obliqua TaxID=2861747 RepID=UPI001C5F23B8|nr:hypothetical protein [Saccharothrix obliqua]MBW4717399.1 hypothetical protein [Saccharothrix obliqua]
MPTLFAIGAEDLGTHEAWIIGWGISFPGSTRVVATDDGHTVSTVRPEDSLRFFAEGGQTRLSLIYAPSIRDALQYRVHRPAESPVEGPAGNRAST